MGLGAHLSNIYDAPLSIGKFQAVDGDDREFTLLYDAGIQDNQDVIVLDDILDSGRTANAVLDYFKDRDVDVTIITLTTAQKFKAKVKDQIKAMRKMKGWVQFPWER